MKPLRNEMGRNAGAVRTVALRRSVEVEMPVMLVVIVLAGLLGGIQAGEAQTWYGWHPWCARYVGGIPIDCAYVSHDQCMLTVSGVSGFCTRNPMPPPLAPPPRRHRRTH
jgi:hypothetical protein